MDIVVLIPQGILSRCRLTKLQEGIWKKAPEPGYEYRIDPENPGTRTLRHVHIARRGDRDAANQISWNVDGRRHDESTTGSRFRAIKVAQRIARSVLNLPDDVILEEADAADTFTGAMRLIESHGRSSDALDVTYFVAKQVVRARLVQ
jgi:Family of unknown function (DUF6367)